MNRSIAVTARPARDRLASGRLARLAVIAASLGLAACASAQRVTGPFGTERLDGPRTAAAPNDAIYNAPYAGGEPVGGYAAAPITSQPLPPPEPRYGAPTDLGIIAPESPAVVAAPAKPEAPRQPPVLSGGGRVATLGESATGSQRPITSRDGLIGSWTAKEANGASCKVQLSSAPALDRYRANAGGCANKDLQKATTWDFQDGEVYLYQPGGGVVARLKSAGGSSLSGVVAKSGAGLSLSR